MSKSSLIRRVIPLFALLVFTLGSSAQQREVTAAEYRQAVRAAREKAEHDYPVSYTSVDEIMGADGKVKAIYYNLEERESAERFRTKRRNTENGQITWQNNEIRLDASNYFVSTDGGKTWKRDDGRLLKMVGTEPPQPDSVRYTVTYEMREGRKLLIYTEYKAFSLGQLAHVGKFFETVSAIDTDGKLVDQLVTQGTLDPKTITQTTKRTWVTKAKFEPITAPK